MLAPAPIPEIDQVAAVRQVIAGIEPRIRARREFEVTAIEREAQAGAISAGGRQRLHALLIRALPHPPVLEAAVVWPAVSSLFVRNPSAFVVLLNQVLAASPGARVWCSRGERGAWIPDAVLEWVPVSAHRTLGITARTRWILDAGCPIPVKQRWLAIPTGQAIISDRLDLRAPVVGDSLPELRLASSAFIGRWDSISRPIGDSIALAAVDLGLMGALLVNRYADHVRGWREAAAYLMIEEAPGWTLATILSASGSDAKRVSYEESWKSRSFECSYSQMSAPGRARVELPSTGIT